MVTRYMPTKIEINLSKNVFLNQLNLYFIDVEIKLQ